MRARPLRSRRSFPAARGPGRIDEGCQPGARIAQARRLRRGTGPTPFSIACPASPASFQFALAPYEHVSTAGTSHFRSPKRKGQTERSKTVQGKSNGKHNEMDGKSSPIVEVAPKRRQDKYRSPIAWS